MDNVWRICVCDFQVSKRKENREKRRYEKKVMGEEKE
jgi:hypothetical protein